jgi:hypothetical protein
MRHTPALTATLVVRSNFLFHAMSDERSPVQYHLVLHRIAWSGV